MATLNANRGLNLHDPRIRAWLYQALALLFVFGGAAYLIANTLGNLERRQISTGFGYLWRASNFEIGEAPIAFSAADTYGRALLVGVLNTLKVGLAGIVLATALGVLVGVSRLSGNALVARISSAYVEAARNVPLLLQLVFWYAVATHLLPPPRQALSLGSVKNLGRPACLPVSG